MAFERDGRGGDVYGDISTWCTGGVTDMQSLFDVDFDYATKFFNYAIGAWNTSGITTMLGMFWEASSFNQSLGDWSVDKVTSMWGMFDGASAFDQPLNGWSVHLGELTTMELMFRDASVFDQDLGWCVAAGLDVGQAFDNTVCELDDCGVTQKNATTGVCSPLLAGSLNGPCLGCFK